MTALVWSAEKAESRLAPALCLVRTSLVCEHKHDPLCAMYDCIVSLGQFGRGVLVRQRSRQQLQLIQPGLLVGHRVSLQIAVNTNIVRKQNLPRERMSASEI